VFKRIIDGPGVMVSTRLPQDIIIFTAGGKLEITGNIVMKFTDSSTTRKLQAASTDAIVEGNEEESFGFVISLLPSFEAEDPAVSAGMIANNGLGGLALVLASAYIYMMW